MTEGKIERLVEIASVIEKTREILLGAREIPFSPLLISIFRAT